MENGFQRGERRSGKELTEAETLYNQIMQHNPESADENSQMTGEETNAAPPEPEQVEPKLQAPLPDGYVPISYVDTPFDSEDAPDFDTNDQQLDPDEETIQIPQDDFEPVPAEEVEFIEESQEIVQPPEDFDSTNADTQPIPAEVVEYEQSTTVEPELEQVSTIPGEEYLPAPAEVFEVDEINPEGPPFEELPPSIGPMDDPVIAPDEEPIDLNQEYSSPMEADSSASEYTTPIISVQDVPTPEPWKKIALILSGGGARGAFQVGAEMYARTVKGYHWDIIAGVSVGAMNAAMLSMHRYARLLEIWNSISDDQVYTGGFNLLSIARLLFGAKSFYGNEPLQKLMKHEFDAGKIIDDLHVGAVSLISGEYVQFTKDFLELPEAILASGTIPVVWPPVDISPEHPSMVDGGVRNNSPVGDVLGLEPDEIVIINCSSQTPPAIACAPDNVLSIGLRALDIMQNEIFINDVKEFLRINALVQEAEQNGVTLHNPGNGKPYKYYPCVVIEPETALGETLDFSQQSVQASLKAGVRRARQVLGRP